MILRGRVVEFSEHVGLGVIESTAPLSTRYPFHCIDIADGTRTIELGKPVLFDVATGVGGSLIACDIQKLTSH
ncbi:MAG: hypothetical protein ACP5PJ_06595 [Acidimicrobiales bacterium]